MMFGVRFGDVGGKGPPAAVIDYWIPVFAGMTERGGLFYWILAFASMTEGDNAGY